VIKWSMRFSRTRWISCSNCDIDTLYSPSPYSSEASYTARRTTRAVIAVFPGASNNDCRLYVQWGAQYGELLMNLECEFPVNLPLVTAREKTRLVNITS
jgi:hypothetical protein